MSLPHRGGVEGQASPEQIAAGHRWKARRDRWRPHTEAQRLQDFDTAEQQDENERDRKR